MVNTQGGGGAPRVSYLFQTLKEGSDGLLQGMYRLKVWRKLWPILFVLVLKMHLGPFSLDTFIFTRFTIEKERLRMDSS